MPDRKNEDRRSDGRMEKKMEENNMINWFEKAGVLIEALPYIREFRGKTIVVKYG